MKNKIKLFVIMLLAWKNASAQPALTTIQDTIYNSVNGTKFSGSLTIQGPNITAPNNIPILGNTFQIFIQNGALLIALVPNDTGIPASTYSLVFSNGDRKTCTVPTSGTPVTLVGANCVDGSQQTVPVSVGLTQLASGGATLGQGLVFGTSWVPGYPYGKVATPSSSSASCSAGQWSFDSNYAYFCTGPSIWKRTPLSTW